MKYLKIIRSFLVIILCVFLVGFNVMPVMAASVAPQTISSTVEFKIDRIVENMEVSYKGQIIKIEKTTYQNDRSVIHIVEDGKSYEEEIYYDYDLLFNNLKGNSNNQPMPLRLEERYVTTMESTEHVGPVQAVYSTVFGAVSIALGVAGLPGSVITGIVGWLMGLGGSSIEANIKTVRHFYGVYDATGTFLGYYNVAYAVYTTAYNADGSPVEMAPEAGTYQSLDIS